MDTGEREADVAREGDDATSREDGEHEDQARGNAGAAEGGDHREAGRWAMTKRQATNALAIQEGACNPRGVARALVESIDEDTAGGMGREKTSPATRLILHQLAWILTGKDIMLGSIVSNEEIDEYELMMHRCRVVRDEVPREVQFIIDSFNSPHPDDVEVPR